MKFKKLNQTFPSYTFLDHKISCTPELIIFVCGFDRALKRWLKRLH